MTLEETSLNIGSRVVGTVAETGVGAYVISQSAVAGAAIGTTFFGVGALPGAFVGSLFGTVVYTFGEVGTAVDNLGTNVTRSIYNWF